MAERVLVTGAAGFLGSHLVRRLLRDGRDVVALVRPRSDLFRLDDVLSDLRLVSGDVRSELRGVQGLDRVFHLAAAGVTVATDDATIVSTNVVGTQHVLDLSRRAGVESFLYCGSCFEYGPGEHHREQDSLHPISAYAASKSAGWLLAQGFGRQHGVHVVGVRPFTVYGPHEAAGRLVPSVCIAAVRGGAVELTAGEQTRDFVFVDDAIDAIVRAGWSAEERTFNVCSGEAVSVREAAELIVALGGGRARLLFGARRPREVEYDRLSGDPSLAADILGWRATTSLRDGLRRTLAWFEARELVRETT